MVPSVANYTDPIFGSVSIDSSSFPTFGNQTEATGVDFFGSMKSNPLVGTMQNALNTYIGLKSYEKKAKIDAQYQPTTVATQTPQNAVPNGQQQGIAISSDLLILGGVLAVAYFALT